MLDALKRLVRRVWRYRSSVTGKWVSRDYAEKHKAETTRERVK